MISSTIYSIVMIGILVLIGVVCLIKTPFAD